MKKTKVLLTILAAAMAASLTACGGSSNGGTATTAVGGSDTKAETAGSTASTDAINFTMAMVDNTSSNYYKGAEKIAECVEKATDGKITMTIQAGGTLGGESDTLDMAVQGDLDIASCANSVLANYISEMGILDQAFLWDSADQANYAVQHELGNLIQTKANEHGAGRIVLHHRCRRYGLQDDGEA